MTVKSPRLAAFETLYKIQQESAYSNLSLDQLPVANEQARAFATALVMWSQLWSSPISRSIFAFL